MHRSSFVSQASLGRSPFLPQVRLGLRPRRLAQAQENPVIRFIVTDEAGERFIQDATVSIVFEDGTLITSKRTDSGGNAAFTANGILQALMKAGLSLESAHAWYTVEAPGYGLKDGLVWDPSKPEEEQVRKIYTVALPRAAGAAPGISPIVGAVAIVTVLAIASYLASKSQ